MSAPHSQTPTTSGTAGGNPATIPSAGSNIAGSTGRVKSGLSCAECRRSKLKCDRSFPCQSCIRRGCAAICPDGTLTATKGNKVLMAHAERLTQQVKAMSVRIKELEQALAVTQNGAHPLLRDADSHDEVAILRDLEGAFAAELEEVSETVGSLSIAQDGKTKYHGETASSEYLQSLMQEGEHPTRHLSNAKFLGLPDNIIDLVNAYPFGLREHYSTVEIFKPFFPPRERANMVADQFYTNASWMYNPVPRPEFEKLICDPIYRAIDGYQPLSSVTAHHISVFFMIMATGLVFSESQSAPILMEQYHALGCASFSMDSITRGASTASVQTLILMIHYSYWTDRSGNELRWLYNGLCARVAQMIGLQRDSAGWNFDKEEVQRRRVSFWEFYSWDAWSSVITGRPPVLNLSQADCRFPDDVDQVVNSQGQLEPGWHKWKFMYTANCLSLSLHRTFSVKALPYETLLDLDKRIRAFSIPEHLRPGSENGQGWSSDPFTAMSQHCATVLRETNLLYIHRSYFAQAIRSSSDPLSHKYGQSVMAAYQSTRALVSSLKGVYKAHPALISKIWFFWSAIFSSCVILGAVVVESPGCKLSGNALADLDDAITLYEQGSVSSRPPSTVPLLRTFHTRAHSAYNEYQVQIKSGGPHVTTPPKDRSNFDIPDELEVLGGRKTVINQSGTASRTAATSRTASDISRTFTTQDGYYSTDTTMHTFDSPSPPNSNVSASGFYSGSSATMSSSSSPPSSKSGDLHIQQTQQAGHQPHFDPTWTGGVDNPKPGMMLGGYSQGPLQVLPRDAPTSLPLNSTNMLANTSSPYLDYNSLNFGQMHPQQMLPPGPAQQTVYSAQAPSVTIGAPVPDVSANLGYHEDIWQNFVQQLGMRTV